MYQEQRMLIIEGFFSIITMHLLIQCIFFHLLGAAYPVQELEADLFTSNSLGGNSKRYCVYKTLFYVASCFGKYVYNLFLKMIKRCCFLIPRASSSCGKPSYLSV